MNHTETTVEDYYRTLGLSEFASSKQIKSAFRRLARMYHPDVPDTGSERMMTRINTAYEVLSNPLRKAAYDQVRQGNGDQPASDDSKFADIDFSIYGFEPLMMAAEEASKGKTKDQVADILVDHGIKRHAADEIAGEIFRTKSRLRWKTVVEAIVFGFYVIILDIAMAGVMRIIDPGMSFYTNMAIGIGVIVVLFSIVGLYRRVTA